MNLIEIHRLPWADISVNANHGAQIKIHDVRNLPPIVTLFFLVELSKYETWSPYNDLKMLVYKVAILGNKL